MTSKGINKAVSPFCYTMPKNKAMKPIKSELCDEVQPIDYLV